MQPVIRSETCCGAKGNWSEERKTREIVYNGNRITEPFRPPEIARCVLQYYCPGPSGRKKSRPRFPGPALFNKR
jgi:hypothetical protein